MSAFAAVIADGPAAHELLLKVPTARRSHAQAIALGCGGAAGAAALKLLLRRIAEAESIAAVAAIAAMPAFARLELKWWHVAAKVPPALRARACTRGGAAATRGGRPEPHIPILHDARDGAAAAPGTESESPPGPLPAPSEHEIDNKNRKQSPERGGGGLVSPTLPRSPRRAARTAARAEGGSPEPESVPGHRPPGRGGRLPARSHSSS